MKNKNLKTINDNTVIKNNDVLIVDIDIQNYNAQSIVSCQDGNLIYHLVTESDCVKEIVSDFCKKLKISSDHFNIHELTADDHFIVIDSSIVLSIEAADDYYDNVGISLLHPSLTISEMKKLSTVTEAVQQMYCIVSKDCKKFYIEKHVLTDCFKLLKE